MLHRLINGLLYGLRLYPRVMKLTTVFTCISV